MIVKSEAIILRTIDYSESSLISTAFTRKHGKIGLIAKGARKPKNKFAAFLEPGQILETVYYYKGSRSVQTLSDLSYHEKLPTLRTDIEKMALVVITMEFCNQVLHDNEVNEPVFNFLLKLLPWIDRQTTAPGSLFPYIQVRMAEHLGIGLQIIEEPKSINGGYINIESGTVSESAEDGNSVRLNENQYLFVNRSLQAMNSSLFEVNLNGHELKTLIGHLDSYFRYHIEGIKPRKSDAIFEQLLSF